MNVLAVKAPASVTPRNVHAEDIPPHRGTVITEEIGRKLDYINPRTWGKREAFLCRQDNTTHHRGQGRSLRIQTVSF
jgi:hypothetical protein